MRVESSSVLIRGQLLATESEYSYIFHNNESSKHGLALTSNRSKDNNIKNTHKANTNMCCRHNHTITGGIAIGIRISIVYLFV